MNFGVTGEAHGGLQLPCQARREALADTATGAIGPAQPPAGPDRRELRRCSVLSPVLIEAAGGKPELPVPTFCSATQAASASHKFRRLTGDNRPEPFAGRSDAPPVFACLPLRQTLPCRRPGPLVTARRRHATAPHPVTLPPGQLRPFPPSVGRRLPTEVKFPRYCPGRRDARDRAIRHADGCAPSTGSPVPMPRQIRMPRSNLTRSSEPAPLENLRLHAERLTVIGSRMGRDWIPLSMRRAGIGFNATLLVRRTAAESRQAELPQDRPWLPYAPFAP